jgi:hypothetical protein
MQKHLTLLASFLAISALLAGCATVQLPPASAPVGSLPPATSVPPPAPPPAVPTPPQFSNTDKDRVTRLLSSMRDLINTAPDLARLRWAAKQPAIDPVLDKRLMELALQLAPLHKAPPEGVTKLMQAQISALNYAKQGLFDQWQTTPTTLPLRPGAEARAEGVIGDLVRQFADIQGTLAVPGAQAFIQAKANELLPERNAMSTPVRRMVTAPLLESAAR